MNEQKLREECLRLAHLHGELPKLTIQRAEAYLGFIQNRNGGGFQKRGAWKEWPFNNLNEVPGEEVSGATDGRGKGWLS